MHILLAAALLAPTTSASATVVTALRPMMFQASAADSIYRAARSAMNNEDFRRAAQLYGELVTRYPRSPRAADATYYRAHSLFRVGGRGDMTAALEALDRYEANYRDGDLRDDARTLRTRICGELARSGDERCGRELTQRATTTRSERGSTSTSSSGSTSSSTRGRSADDEDERMMALNALLHMDSPQAIPLLKGVLERRDAGSAKLRSQALFMLSQKRSPEVIDLLLSTAKNDPDAEVRANAVFWMSQTNDPRAVDVLQDLLLRGSSRDVQEKAIFALSQIRGSRAMGLLKDYATQKGGPLELRGNAIFWLGQESNNIEFLKSLYTQLDEAELKDKVIFGLGQSRAGRPVLLDIAKNARENETVRGQAIFWLGQGSGSVADLIALYSSLDTRELKDKVVFGLSQSRDAAAIEKLIDIARTDRDPELRKQAIFWLGQSKDPRAIRLLQELINR